MILIQVFDGPKFDQSTRPKNKYLMNESASRDQWWFCRWSCSLLMARFFMDGAWALARAAGSIFAGISGAARAAGSTFAGISGAARAAGSTFAGISGAARAAGSTFAGIQAPREPRARPSPEFQAPIEAWAARQVRPLTSSRALLAALWRGFVSDWNAGTLTAHSGRGCNL